MKKLFSPGSGQHLQDVGLQPQGDFPRLIVNTFAGRLQLDAPSAAVFFVRFARHQASRLHPLQKRRHRVWIAAHDMGEFLLAHTPRIPFEQGAHDRELVRRHAEMRDATAKGLVQAVPGAAQQRGQTAALRRVNREVDLGLVVQSGRGHKNSIALADDTYEYDLHSQLLKM